MYAFNKKYLYWPALTVPIILFNPLRHMNLRNLQDINGMCIDPFSSECCRKALRLSYEFLNVLQKQNKTGRQLCKSTVL